ncbi:hypothetical protein J4439_03875 [Candidatus Woesearchaeota archaeon]|nr:hypothetical protein [Candidatus Woesearchaeota archaeon]
MQTVFLASIAAFLIVLYVIFRFVKNVVSTLIWGAVALGVVLLAAGFLVYLDIRDLRENFSNSSKLVLLAGEQDLVLGLEISAFELDATRLLSGSELSSLKEAYGKREFKTMLGNSSMLFILKDASLDEQASLGEVFTLVNERFSSGKVTSLLREYRKGNLIIYPETPVFKLLRLFPGGVSATASRAPPSEDASRTA